MEVGAFIIGFLLLCGLFYFQGMLWKSTCDATYRLGFARGRKVECEYQILKLKAMQAFYEHGEGSPEFIAAYELVKSVELITDGGADIE